MAKLITAILLTIVLAGCAAPGDSGVPASGAPESGDSAPPVGGPEPVDWDRAAETPGYDLCREDAVADVAPIFGDPEKTEEGIVRHGLIANSQGELFRIDVTGVDDVPVKGYLSTVKVCLDVSFAGGGAAEGQQAEMGNVAPAAALAGEDLIIRVTLAGFVDPAADPVKVAGEIGPLPIDEWAGQLKERNASLETARPDDVGKDYIIDAVFDPQMGRVTHQYRELYVTKVRATVSASRGAVMVALCRNSSSPLKATTVAAVATGDPLSDSQTAIYRYDLAVKGTTSDNIYKVSKSWWVPGWTADYPYSPPTGSVYNCYP
jgi:hypothetical protein